jgi:hypothetical protein
MPRPSQIEELIHDHTAVTLGASLRIAIEQIAGEIAQETLKDEQFRRALRETVQQTARQILADIGRTQPDRRRPAPADSEAL